MKARATVLLIPALCVWSHGFAYAQCSTNGAVACNAGVPHFVKFNGAVKDLILPPSHVVAIRFDIYGDSTGGTALWEETQNVEVDSQGRYEVMLGVSSDQGVPVALFTSGQPRWLGAQALLPGAQEQPRVLLVSVPYALEAADAQTLGGLPASAFAQAVAPVAAQPTPSDNTSGGTQAGALGSSASPATSTDTPAGSAVVGRPLNLGVIPKFSKGASLVDSQIQDDNGVVSIQDLSNILFADRFSGGVPDAVKACPANGCIIYAVSPNVNLNLGTIDPGTKAITIYLGPYTYTVKQITLRKALKIIGMGASGGANSAACNPICNGTTLQSVNGNSPVFVLPQTNSSAVSNVLLSGFRVYGSAGNTSEDGFFLDTSSTLIGGLWFSTFDDIYLQGFAGIAIHIRGRNNDFGSMCQWLLFNNVVAFRTQGGGNALRLEGSSFELRFRNCEFDGQAVGDGVNIYMGGESGGISAYPLSIAFEGLVSQNAATAVQIDGGVHINFYGSHHEQLWGAYQINNSFGIWTQGVTITDSYFAGDVGNNAGSGYLLNITTTLAKGISFTHNSMFGHPDSVVKGTNLSSVAYQDNMYQPVIYEDVGQGTENVPPTSGISMQLAPAAIINIQGAHSIALNPSTAPITTIRSTLGPGEIVTFFTFAGPVIFSSGGNINLMGSASVTLNGSITFIREDLEGSLQWIPVAQWNAPMTSTASNSRILGSRDRRQLAPDSTRIPN